MKRLGGWRTLSLLVTAAACGDGAAPAPDAMSDGSAVDVAPIGEAGSATLAVDFTVRGCTLLDPTIPRCSARAPASLEFVPISAGSVNRYLWDFGDGSPRASDRTPTHTYALPGTYDVRVVAGGAAGSVQKAHAGFVVVTTNGVSQGCDVDAQCEAGLVCICGSAARCSAAFPRGICSAACGDRACRAAEVCANLALPAGATTRAEPWQAPLCFGACSKDLDCPVGLRCRDLPARTPTGAWVRGCFSDAGGEVGASCRSARGQLLSESCITGLCADLGANGVCSLDCSRGACPGGSTCVRFEDSRTLCLRTCAGDAACSSDPLLACLPPNPGPLGFRPVATAGADARFCAPRTCRTECPPVALCRDNQNGGHCVRRDG